MILKLIIALLIFFGLLAIVITPTNFDSGRLFTSTLPMSSPAPLTTILLTGDVMLGRSVNTTSLEANNPEYPFENVKKEIKGADISFINLENPIVKNCPKVDTGFVFCADPEMTTGLKNAGVDVITLANNHTLNYGKVGLEETKNHLDLANILHTDGGNLVVKNVNNTEFGFLGFDKSQQSSPVLTDSEIQLIELADREVDVLIIAMHWGVEYQNTALPGVRNLAKEIVALGADVVVGSHPHWVQNMEYIGATPVYYSLGNFIFDQMWSEETKKGMAIRLTFDGKNIVREEKLPTYMPKLGQPIWVKQ